MKQWYVAHSKPRSEELLWKQYCIRDLESYYPCMRVRTVNPRARQVQPYFPGYLFVHVDLMNVGISALEWVPGSDRLVSFGDEPATISESLVLAIRRRVEELDQAFEQTSILMQKGDSVMIHDGALSGYEGIFDIYLSGTERVRVLLSLLGNRQLPVELPASYLQRVYSN